MKKFLTLLVAILMLFLSRGDALAHEEVAYSSASLSFTTSVKTQDNRAEILREYLAEQNSPLAEYADELIRSADKHDLDWRLVASIAGLESTYGKHIPANSKNAWGWGYNAGSVKHFESWEEAIEEISRGLRENYLYDSSDSDPYLIGPKYAASPTWAARVTYFMNKIEVYRVRNAKSTLALAL